MRLLLNIIWLVFAGIWAALGWALAALIMFVLIITIPFGIAAIRIAVFSLWPVCRSIVRHPCFGVAISVCHVIWFLLAGWWLALLHLVSGVVLCLTIIGIPL